MITRPLARSMGLKSITLQQMPSGAWRGVGTGDVGVVGRFVENHSTPAAALAAVLVAPVDGSGLVVINRPPGRVTFPKPATVPGPVKSRTIYRPLRTKVWPPQPPMVPAVSVPPVVPPALPPITPVTRMTAAFPTEVREYVNDIARIVDAYNAGGAARAALGTADLIALLEWMEGKVAMGQTETLTEIERVMDEEERAQQ